MNMIIMYKFTISIYIYIYILYIYETSKMVIPSLIFWLGIYPLLFIGLPLILNRNKLNTFAVRNSMGYQYNGYDKRFFYW